MSTNIARLSPVGDRLLARVRGSIHCPQSPRKRTYRRRFSADALPVALSRAVSAVVDGDLRSGDASSCAGVSPTGPAPGDLNLTNSYDNTVTATIPVGDYPTAIAVSPTGSAAGYVYVNQTDADTIPIINPATNAIVATVDFGTPDLGPKYSPDNWVHNVQRPPATLLVSTTLSGSALPRCRAVPKRV